MCTTLVPDSYHIGITCVPKVPQRFPKGSPKLPRRFPRRFPEGSPKVPRRFPEGFPNVFRRFPQGSPKVCRRFPECSPEPPESFPEVPRRFPEGSPGRCRGECGGRCGARKVFVSCQLTSDGDGATKLAADPPQTHRCHLMHLLSHTQTHSAKSPNIDEHFMSTILRTSIYLRSTTRREVGTSNLLCLLRFVSHFWHPTGHV